MTEGKKKPAEDVADQDLDGVQGGDLTFAPGRFAPPKIEPFNDPNMFIKPDTERSLPDTDPTKAIADVTHDAISMEISPGLSVLAPDWLKPGSGK